MIIPIIGFTLATGLLYGIAKNTNFHQLADRQLSKRFKSLGLESRYFQIDNHTKIHYWIGGQGKPLLMLHGFGAAAKYQWGLQIKAFLKTRQLIIPDLIYFGESKSTSEQYSLEFQADCMQKLVEHLELKKIDVVGLSYGGLVATMLAKNLGSQIEKLAICGSPVRYFTDEHLEDLLKKQQVDSIEELLVPSKKENLKKLIHLAVHKPPFIPDFILKDFHAATLRDQPEQKKKLLTYLIDNRAELATIEFDLSCKILLLWGSHDMLIPNKIGEQLEKDFGTHQATYMTIDKTAHAPNAERPGEYNKLILDFLEK